MMTVLHLRDSPFVGGPEKQILGQCARLDCTRFEPIIASFASGKPNTFLQEAMALGMRTAVLPDGKLAAVSAGRLLKRIVRAAGECVVIASGFKADFTAALAGVPWLAWFHGRTSATARVRLYEALDVVVLRRALGVIAVCARAALELRARGLHNVIVIPNAVDVEHIESCGTRLSARAELGIGDEPVAGTVSRLSPEKGIEYFIDAAPMVLKQCPAARFVVIGGGPLSLKLSRRAELLGLADRLTFVGHRPDAARLIKAMDVFVLPSLRENMPVALLEAMACGVSLVASDVGGVGEVLSGTGVQPIAPGSPQAIATAVSTLLADPSLRAAQAAALKARANDFSFDHQVRQFETLLSDIAEARNARPRRASRRF